MAIPTNVTNVTNITLTGYGGANTFVIYVKSVTTGITLGSYEVNGTGFLLGASLTTAEQIYIEFDEDPNAPDLAIGDIINVFCNSGTLPVLVQETPVDGEIWYLDSNGVPYSDSALTLLWLSQGHLLDDSVAASEDSDNSEWSDEVITVAELATSPVTKYYTDDILTYEIAVSEEPKGILDSIVLEEDLGPEEVGEALQRLILAESSFIDSEYDTADSISISEEDSVEGFVVADQYVVVEEMTKKTADTYYFVLVTEAFDMGIRARKFIESVIIGSADTGTLEAALDFRFAKDESWTRTSYVSVNEEGIAHLTMAGIEFRVVIRSTVKTDNKPDYIGVNWKAIDKRGIRGPYVQSN